MLFHALAAASASLALGGWITYWDFESGMRRVEASPGTYADVFLFAGRLDRDGRPELSGSGIDWPKAVARLRAVRETAIKRPSEVDPRLSPEIDQILMTALAKDKTRRYPSAGAFGQKLRSLRYSLEVTVGDPATELAKIIDSAEEVERQSQQRITPSAPSGRFDFDPSEATVIRIRTADAFSARDNDASIVRARQVIDRFEEEETRLAQLSGDQLKMLRSRNARDSNEMTATAEPMMRSTGRLQTPASSQPVSSSMWR